MTIRKLSVPIEISASQKWCDECSFQHSEHSYCILFDVRLEHAQVKGDWNNKRCKECAVAEWKAKKYVAAMATE